MPMLRRGHPGGMATVSNLGVRTMRALALLGCGDCSEGAVAEAFISISDALDVMQDGHAPSLTNARYAPMEIP